MTMHFSTRASFKPLLQAARANHRIRVVRAISTSRAFNAKESVRIVEVGPRDGLQNEKKSIPVATKIELVDRLTAVGLQTIEAGSFVSPKWVPQMANSSEILEHILGDSSSRPRNITYQWLLPNIKGLENYFAALNASKNSGASAYLTPPLSPASDGAPATNTTPTAPKHEVSIFLAATESFSKKNTNCTIAESLDRFRPLIRQSLDAGTSVRAYISVALGCPYEGAEVDPHKVAELAATLLEIGANEISVADTTGMGTAPRTLKLMQTLTAAGIQNEDLAFHFHDTYGQALVNTVVALEHGVRTFDSAVGGLGGCPFSPGATGNVATEDLVHCIHGLGADTGLDVVKLAEIGEWISGEIGRVNESRAGKATLAKLRAA